MAISLRKLSILIRGPRLTLELQVMGLSHPAIDTRDSALFLPFRRTLRHKPNNMIPLATLMNQFMGRTIGQHGEVPVSQ